MKATPVLKMFHPTISTFLLVLSTVLLVASKSSVPWSSDERRAPPSFPPEPPFELKGILPPATFSQLTAIHQNQSLTIPQKIAEIDEIINSLPVDVLQRLPLPPVFRSLPQDVQEMIKVVRTAKNLTVQEKWLQMTVIIESLPEEQKRILQQAMPDLPPTPSLEFKDILPKEAWDQLVTVYQDINLDKAQKMKRIDEIMDALPDSIRQKLPLSSSLQKLPVDIQHKLQAIHMERGLSAEQRVQRMTAILGSHMKKLIFPH
ncbi:hypothetical protein LOAG_00657 [Loa loa]|uniref:DUF148 domain-containing protein n=1 Tax=Loa loa TaxID=7209 RepID=A0A1I7VRC3_LOALO|nr:hypothetical protein LOAG_00657 [Loa loa]EFO27821.1 hypothetical protein LOAG_00657 [Loa loa]